MIISKKNIECKYINLYKEMIGKKVIIPNFQRFYDWKAEHCIPFIDDIESLLMESDDSKELYLFDFIYYENEGLINIADGQQRLLTFNNFIKALKEVISEKQIRDDIELLQIEYEIEEYQIKYDNHYNLKKECSPFKKNYLYFKEYLNKKNEEDLNKIIKIIKNKIFIYIKKCVEIDDAFLIFQQINTGGRPMTKDEVIKSTIEQYCSIYKINTLKENNISDDDINIFLFSYYRYEKKVTNKVFKITEIINFLKEKIIKDKEHLQDFCHLIISTKRNLEHPINTILNWINRKTIKHVLNVLSLKKICIDESKNSMYLNKVIYPLCLLSIICTFSNSSPTSFSYLLDCVIESIKENKKPDDILSKIIEEVNKNSTTFKIKFETFKQILGDEDYESHKKALLVLDILIHNMSGTINLEKINLEHIYPKKPVVDWSMNGWPTSDEDKDKLVNNIGNYILLNEKVNKKIQNNYISDKRKEYDKIKKKDNLLNTEIEEVDFDKFEQEKDVYIQKRQLEISEYICNKFPLGKVLIEKNNN